MAFDIREPPVSLETWAQSLALETAEDRIIFGKKAAALLQDLVVARIFATMQSQVMLEWDRCPPEDTEKLAALKLQAMAVRAMKTQLRAYADEGQLEEKQSPS